MRKNLFWLSDEQWKQIKPHLPTDVRGVSLAAVTLLLAHTATVQVDWSSSKCESR